LGNGDTNNSIPNGNHYNNNNNNSNSNDSTSNGSGNMSNSDGIDSNNNSEFRRSSSFGPSTFIPTQIPRKKKGSIPSPLQSAVVMEPTSSSGMTALSLESSPMLQQLLALAQLGLVPRLVATNGNNPMVPSGELEFDEDEMAMDEDGEMLDSAANSISTRALAEGLMAAMAMRGGMGSMGPASRSPYSASPSASVVSPSAVFDGNRMSNRNGVSITNPLTSSAASEVSMPQNTAPITASEAASSSAASSSSSSAPSSSSSASAATIAVTEDTSSSKAAESLISEPPSSNVNNSNNNAVAPSSESAPAQVAPPRVWACGTCTFENDRSSPVCSMCGGGLRPVELTNELAQEMERRMKKEVEQQRAKEAEDAVKAKEFFVDFLPLLKPVAAANGAPQRPVPVVPESDFWACPACTVGNSNLYTAVCSCCEEIHKKRLAGLW